ncbi:MAG: hypothetical protein GY725_14155 [bacterium]|nr:hypothetical protein [bacterium]
MNTPAHLILGLAALGKGPRREWNLAIAAGSLVPDVAMFGFFFWQSFVLQHPQAQIWETEYFRGDWQLFFDLFNSIPAAALGAILAWWKGWERTRVFFLAVILHCLVDLGLHHDDGHRHFLPFSEFRFSSPVSYWDPAYNGAWGAALESITVVAGSALLWTRSKNRIARAGLLALCALQGLGFGAAYLGH